MINHIFVKFYRWNTETGVATPMFTDEGDWAIDLIEHGMLSVANTNIVVEGDGDKIMVSDTGIVLSNRNSDLGALPSIYGNKIGGSIYDHTWGVFSPLFESGGVEIVVAECLITGKFGSVVRLAPVGSDMQTGEIDTYAEFIEDIDDEQSVVIMPGYIELKTLYQNDYTNTVNFSIISLAKLFSVVRFDSLGLPPFASTTEILNTIAEKTPFIDGTEIETMPFGSVFLPVPLKIESDISEAPIGITDSRFDHFSVYPEDNAKIIVWSYGYDEEFYVFLKNTLNEATDIKALKIKIPFEAEATIEYLTATDADLDKFSLSDLNENHESYTNTRIGKSGILDAPYPSPATTKNPCALNWRREEEDDFFGSVFCSYVFNIMNMTTAFNTVLGNYCAFSIGTLGDAVYRIFSKFDTTTETFSIPEGIGTGSLAGSIEDYGDVFWFDGWKRFAIISRDRKKYFTFPEPCVEEHENIERRPFEWTELNVYSTILGSIYWSYPLQNVTVKLVSPNLGSGDDYPITGFYNNRFFKYPVYHTNASEDSFVLLIVGGSDGVGLVYRDADDLRINVSSDYPDGYVNSSVTNPPEDYYVIEPLENDIPSDMPMRPIFRYDDRDRLEIWYYSDSKKALLCYDWRMNLKYGYKIGVPFENVAIGKDKDGKIIFLVTTENYIIFARHEQSSEIYFTNIEEQTDSVESVLLTLAKANFSMYWVDRTDGVNKLFFKNRYSGINREGVEMKVRTDMTSSYPDNGEDLPPNRTLKREIYGKFADKIDVDSFLGECASVGMENSLYEFNYGLGDIFHIDLGNRIAQKLLYVLSKRREMLTIPLQAFRCSAYDRIKPIDGTEYSVLTQKSDFMQELKTDVECVEMGDIYKIDNKIDCILRGFYWNPNDGWGYSGSNTPTCYNPSCNNFYDTFMDRFLLVIQSVWSPDPETYPEGLEITEEVLIELTSILYENLMTVVDGELTLFQHLLNYIECLENFIEI